MFEKCKNEQEVKELFRRLAKHLHPDVGGEADLMARLQDSKNYHIELFQSMSAAEAKEKAQQQNERYYQNVFEDVFSGQHNIEELIYEMEEYAKQQPRFNRSFLDDVTKFLEGNGYITSSQYNALVKIYYSFRMDKRAQ